MLDALKKELIDQFYHCNIAWVAREILKKLKHTGSVRDYMKEFSSLMLDIKNLSGEDKLFNMLRLQPQAQIELRSQTLKGLSTVIAATDGLVDYKFGGSSSNQDNCKGKDGKFNHCMVCNKVGKGFL